MEKAAHKILVKLTPIFNQFHQYLRWLTPALLLSQTLNGAVVMATW